MTFEEFAEKIKDWMEEYTGEEYILQNTLHINGQKNMAIQKKQITPNVPTPCIRLLPYYQDVNNGNLSFVGAASVIENLLKADLDQNITQAVADLSDFEKSKPLIYATVCNAEKNREYLQDCPTRIIADSLCIQYRILAQKDKNGVSSAKIPNHLIDKWGITEQELYEIAMKNTPRLFPLEITNNMRFIILSNKEHIHGATVLLYPEIKSLIREDMYIFPSSVHEIIIVSKMMFCDLQDAENLVHDANQCAVAPDEFLSDNVFAFRDGKLVNLSAEKEREEMELGGME